MKELKVIIATPHPKMKNSCDGAIEVYLKSEVDAAIAGLKQKLQDQCISCPVKMQEDDVVAEFKEKLEDAGMRERRLRRALYKACANWADVVAFEETEGIGYENSVAERWRKMESKCRAKAETNKLADGT